ncbi:glycine betaine ABC transporter substrate-binding protein [Pseudomonas sp. dw_358]|uniref:glycine betaine ABC transporter substrate-binding protein n=1 Tax=Pseudomonas sp. dw_358 TaxID=2720083 RepID=UPI001BD3904F|nr:glycine betaine ABC transporter substrate-binding protein [Pseudomonas sp. dw_358]
MLVQIPRTRTLASWMTGITLAAASLLAHGADPAPLRIGWVNWADTEITVKLATLALEDQLKQPVKLVNADIGIQFQAMANGNIDLIPMVWLPTTHKAFWDKYKDQLEDLGPLYEGRIGMAVPTSIPVSEIASIADLNKPEVKQKLGGTILTSEAGNGQYKLTLKAMDAYKLTGYKMVASSETGMLTEFDRNQQRGKWSVINAWSPHWMFSKYSLRYLDDPKHTLGGAEQIHAVARKGFSKEYPQVAAFFAHYSLPKGDLETLMMQGRQTSPDQATAAYYAAHKPMFAAMFMPNATASANP